MNFPTLAKALTAIFASSALLKFGNENYEALKADGGLIMPILCLIGGAALFIYGIKNLVRAFAR